MVLILLCGLKSLRFKSKFRMLNVQSDSGIYFFSYLDIQYILIFKVGKEGERERLHWEVKGC